MSKVVCNIAASLDGYVAGLNQSLEHPLGVGAERVLHTWMFDAAEENADELAEITDAGAFIMGRNMFGPVRGEWEGDWRGWWGEEPPYHGPVFVLTHHERAPLPMDGGTTFHFVTGGIDEALGRAREAAGERNVSVAGGASTVNQFLAADLLDELRLHVAPVLLGAGERLFEGVGRTALDQVGARQTSLVTHLRYAVRRG
ncbi:dihydrofolate reductase family protein [Virgisporangium ochraceum]|uniref:Deaminase reductase n=1 Tax=Virgisporangium ochraceum TaxID=65505 RepID=A0A8J3ZW60_9ACTN|nr:dihydrofolate reductase family protein [Virgisporangium ochraceum]GIJ71084.1 deaminase reductase [Virgisporangium ochraceum]